MTSKNVQNPIGVFDSGLGGISVLKDLVKILPNEDFIYFGDSKNAPYGVKPVEEVVKLSESVMDYLKKQNVKAVVIACNTATSAAVKKLRLDNPNLPIVGIEPALKPAVKHKKNSTVIVLATELTLRENKFIKLAEKFENEANIIKIPAPRLVEFVEKGDLDTIEVENYLHNLLDSYRDQVDSIVLGCTHFPFVKPLIKKIVGNDVYVVDGGMGVSNELKSLLSKNNILRKDNNKGRVIFKNSNSNTKEIQLSERLYNV